MTKQVNSRKPAPKKRSFKRKPTNKKSNVIIGGAFLALLIVLIIGGITALMLTNGNDRAVNGTNAMVTNVKATSGEKSALDKNKQDAEKADIASLIRLVLFDYEIARSAVEERTTKTQKGKITYHFSVKAPADYTSKLRGAVESLLEQKGYKIAVGKNGNIVADSKIDAVSVEFVELNHPTTDENINKDKSVKQDVIALGNVENRPTPPMASDVVVKMAILLDDGGSNINLVKRYVQLPFPVGIAVLPHLQYSQEAAKTASSYGKSVFLHFPMEPKSYPSTDPGDGAALVNMPELLIEAVVKKNFESLGVPVDGFNNHMGSAFTEDKVKMAQVFATAAKYTNSFIDSRTTASSVAFDECAKAGLKCGVNKKFIDNDADVNAIITKIYEGAEIAKKNGEVLLIGHIRPHTLDALEIALPILHERKITIVPVTSMVR